MSRVGDRDGDSFVSPSEQRERIEAACERDGLKLIEALEEPNISGGAALEKRHGLRQAVEAIEGKRADVIVVAYFDRLVRSLAVQTEVVSRVEAAGGAILAVDIGEVRADTASRWLSSTMLGMVAEYHRRVVAERTVEAKRRAIERGVPTFDRIPPGYQKRRDRTIEIRPTEGPVVREAFRMRANGETIDTVRQYLRANGIGRSYHGVQAMLGSRFYLGELRFGDMLNLESHEPLVDLATWTTVQRMKVTRGRRGKSERLLARLGVLRCANCGSRMIVGTRTVKADGKRYQFYRCPTIGDCDDRCTIAAEMVEGLVVSSIKERLSGIEAGESLTTAILEAEAALERADAELNAAVEAFSGIDVASARDRLIELRDARDTAGDRVRELRAADSGTLRVSIEDFESLSIADQRTIIRAAVDSVTVARGRGLDRVSVNFREEPAPSLAS